MGFVQTILKQQYQAMTPYILNNLRESAYNTPILNMTLGDKTLSINAYVRTVRMKYWSALFEHPDFVGKMTSNLKDSYTAKVKELKDYDFSLYNIKSIQLEMSRSLISGIEECIIKLFDELSYQYSYSDELSKNIHYFNGWKTNKCWIINKKVIIPYMRAWDNIFNRFRPSQYDIIRKLSDIEKALNYLDGGLTTDVNLIKTLEQAEKEEQTKHIHLKYFDITFYKKGTCHIEFTNEELLKKLNIFGCQQKRWLPPAYGKKRYFEMDTDERAVVDEFEGQASYENTVTNADYYIYNPQTAVLQIEDTLAS